MKILLILFLLLSINSIYPQMINEDIERISEVNTKFDEVLSKNNFGFYFLVEGEKYQRYPEPVEVHPILKFEFFYRENYRIPQVGYICSMISMNISPISMNLNIDLNLKTLYQMLEMPVGVVVGSGWYDSNFGSGIGIYSNFYDANVTENLYSSENFSKIYLKYYIGSIFKFDLSYFTETSGNLQVALAQFLYYRYFLGTTRDSDIWLYENRDDNLKYFRYVYEIYLGYKLPIMINQIGLFFSSDYDIQHYDDSPAKGGGWGSDIPINKFGVLIGCGDRRGWGEFKLKLTWGNEPAYEEGYGKNLILYKRRIKLPETEYYFLKKVSIVYTIMF